MVWLRYFAGIRPFLFNKIRWLLYQLVHYAQLVSAFPDHVSIADTDIFLLLQ